MPDISPVTSHLRDLWDRANAALTSVTGSPPKPVPTSADRDAALAETVERLPPPILPRPEIVARMNPIVTKLDQAKAEASGPYLVGDKTVYSGIQFKMAGGHNEGTRGDPRVEAPLQKAIAAAGLSVSTWTLHDGRATPRAVVKVTQALIDAGYLPKGSTKPLADQIHDLQWRFGIGLDCAGYVYNALRTVYGDPAKLGLKPSEIENFQGTPNNPHFTRVASAAGVRAGDILVLGGRRMPVDPGHNLIVRSSSMVDLSAAGIAQKYQSAQAFADHEGAKGVLVVEVDSSFGAGKKGDADGGVRRDVLLYGKASGKWLTCQDTRPPTTMEGDVPYGEAALTGFFRPRTQP
jgi:hypothetical protein